MTDRELLQRAYEVPLHEQLARVPRNARLVIDDVDGRGTRYIPVGRMCHEAADALRARLAQPDGMAKFEFQEYGPPNWGDSQAAQPEPEPVAWLTDREEMYFDKEDAKRYSDGFIQPLYTAPPQRKEWQGLTQAQCGAMWKKDMSLYDFYQAIEVKLKEKNTLKENNT